MAFVLLSGENFNASMQEYSVSIATNLVTD